MKTDWPALRLAGLAAIADRPDITYLGLKNVIAPFTNDQREAIIEIILVMLVQLERQRAERSSSEFNESNTQAPPLFIFEEIEIGGGYHALSVAINTTKERDWSEPYAKSGGATYRNRIVRVPYPPKHKR